MEMMNGIGTVSVRAAAVKNKKNTSSGKVQIKAPEKKKIKKLKYNFKEISDQILQAKTSGTAGVVAIRARVMVVMLLGRKSTGEYDSTEVEHALVHARKMVRIAKKRTRHLKEEEAAASGRGSGEETQETRSLISKEDAEREKELEQKEKELQKLEEEYERMMQESLQETIEDMAEWSELGEEERMEVVQYDMDPEDLERLKKKHRSEELREIMEADMKYLKGLMNRLQKEKQEGSGGVSLQLAGVEMPVEAPMSGMPADVAAEGGNVDISL